MGWHYGGYGFRPYVSAAQRRRNAEKEAAKLAKKGEPCCPVVIEGLKIARTFWGKAWCEHLEKFSDYANRLPRGRTYVRNRSVIDLKITPGAVHALVMGSELYKVKVEISPVAPEVWRDVKSQCAGQIGSLIELLQGKLSKSVMEVVTRRDKGLFPMTHQIEMDCSCPDYAGLCKHIAAVMYGIGARLDEQPELLFTLRKVDHLELIAGAGDVSALDSNASAKRKTIAEDKLADVFGIEFDDHEVAAPSSKMPNSSLGMKKVTVKRKRGAGAKGGDKLHRRRVKPVERTVRSRRRAVK